MKVLRFVFGRRQYLRRRKREIMAALSEKGAVLDEGLTTIKVEGGAAYIKFLKALQPCGELIAGCHAETMLYEVEPLVALPQETLDVLEGIGARPVE